VRAVAGSHALAIVPRIIRASPTPSGCEYLMCLHQDDIAFLCCDRRSCRAQTKTNNLRAASSRFLNNPGILAGNSRSTCAVALPCTGLPVATVVQRSKPVRSGLLRQNELTASSCGERLHAIGAASAGVRKIRLVWRNGCAFLSMRDMAALAYPPGCAARCPAQCSREKD